MLKCALGYKQFTEVCHYKRVVTWAVASLIFEAVMGLDMGCRLNLTASLCQGRRIGWDSGQ